MLRILKDAGCIVWTNYFPNLEEIYALSDCYVFPTINRRACIETPLSVLEAMACNLPVITTKFGALPRMFKEGEGLFFIKSEREVSKIIEILKNNNLKIKTREKILPYSWEVIGKRLIKIYSELIYS